MLCGKFHPVWSAVSLEWLGPKVWIPAQVLLFGLVCMCTGFIKTFSQFVAVRVLLGLAEGGVLPALALLLSRFYTRAELVFRIAIFVSAASLAGGFGGLLASAFIAMGEVGTIGAAWRNIFVFEGLLTIVIAFPTYFILANEPKTARFLNEFEKDLAIRRLQQPGASRAIASNGDMKGTLLKQAISAPTNWFCSLGYLTVNVSVQGISLFLPTIIKSLYPGMSTVDIQLRTVPPFMVAFVFTLGTAYVSKRLNQRAWVMLASLPFAIIGYVIFVATNEHQKGARYAGAFLCIMGAFPIGPFFLSWAANNAASDTERGVVTGMVPGIGQFGALIASWSYLPKDAPNYVPGNALNVGCATLCFLLTATHRYYCHRQNKLRNEGVISKRAAAIGGAEADPDMSILGSQHPDFRYSY